MWWMNLALAGTADLDAVKTRLAEVAPLMSKRISTSAPRVPGSAWEKAAGGTIATGVAEVSGHAAKIGWGVAVLDVDVERFWLGLQDESLHQDLLNLGHVEVVKGKACQDRRHVMMLLPLPLVSDRWWVVENHENHALRDASGGQVRELMWKEVDAASATLSETAQSLVADAVPLAFNTGAWLLIGLQDQTLVEYHSWSDPGGEIPAGPATSFANGAIADTIRAMESYAVNNEPRCSL